MDELDRQLLDQRELLRMAAQNYDAGALVAHKHIAVTLRTLLHDTNASHSLLGQMGLLDKIEWWTSEPPLPPGGIPIMEFGLASLQMKMGVENEVSWSPKLADDIAQIGVQAPSFHAWWKQPFMTPRGGSPVSRRAVVLAVTNKAGGAHVDALQQWFRDLASGATIGVQVSQGDDKPVDFTDSPIPAYIRTICAETLYSLDRLA